MPDLPKSVIERMKGQAAPQEHPGADLLSAFSEQALAGRERENVLAHLAVCAACREAVALAAPPSVAEQPGGVFVPWYKRPQIFAWAGTLATLALVGALVLNYSQSRYSTSTVSDATPSKVTGTQPAENKPAASPAQDAMNGTLGALTREGSPRLAAPLAKAEPGQKKKAEKEYSRRDIATAAAPMQAPTKDEKKLDGGVLRDQFSVMKQAAPPPAPVGGPATQAANAVTDKAQNSATTEASSVESTVSAPAKSAGNAGGVVGGALYQSRAAKMAAVPVFRWTISDKGKLQRSFDAGRSWQPALANETTVFRALAVVGNEVWAGGSAVTLFHSADGGANWSKQTLPGASADVVSLQFSDAQHGSARTADGTTWATADGGQRWTKQ